MIRLGPLRPGSKVAIEVPGILGGAVEREIVTVRDHGDGRFTVRLSAGPSAATETATIARASNHAGWVCVDPPPPPLRADRLALSGAITPTRTRTLT